MNNQSASNVRAAVTFTPTNFKVPKRFNHEFVLFYENNLVGRITGCPGEKQIRFEQFNPAINISDEQQRNFNRLSFDWMGETIEHLKFLCQG